MQETQLDDRSDLGALGDVLRRRLWIVVVTFVVAAAAAFVYSKLQTAQYQSSATLLFRNVYLDVALTGTPLQEQPSDQTESSSTNVDLVSAENVRLGAATILGPPYTASSLKDDVSISAESQSDLVQVQATASSPSEAARVANAMAQSYLNLATQQNTAEIATAVSRVHAAIVTQTLTAGERQALQQALVKLAVLQSIGPQYVHLVETATPPTSKSSPKTMENVLIGAIVGLILGLALAFGLEQVDRRLRTPDDLGRAAGLPVLASVPASDLLASRLRTPIVDTRDTEPFRQLASTLRHGVDGESIRSVLVTSARPAAGGSTVALHLAVAGAALGGSAFLLEADLRHPSLARSLNLPASQGLTTIADGSADDQGAVHAIDLGSVPDSPYDHGSGTGSFGESAQTRAPAAQAPETLSVMVAGPPVARTGRLFESRALRDLLDRSRIRYDLTVVDAPPPTLVADSIPLVKAVDAVIIVARIGRDTPADVRRVVADLRRIGITPLGVVATFAKQQENPYYPGDGPSARKPARTSRPAQPGGSTVTDTPDEDSEPSGMAKLVETGRAWLRGSSWQRPNA